jgi:hypothetical protein
MDADPTTALRSPPTGAYHLLSFGHRLRFMTLTAEERNEVAERLAEIKAELDHPLLQKPDPDQARRVAELDRERTGILRKLAAEDS